MFTALAPAATPLSARKVLREIGMAFPFATLGEGATLSAVEAERCRSAKRATDARGNDSTRGKKNTRRAIRCQACPDALRMRTVRVSAEAQAYPIDLARYRSQRQ